jgi:hypothetical protein
MKLFFIIGICILMLACNNEYVNKCKYADQLTKKQMKALTKSGNKTVILPEFISYINEIAGETSEFELFFRNDSTLYIFGLENFQDIDRIACKLFSKHLADSISAKSNLKIENFTNLLFHKKRDITNDNEIIVGLRKKR